MKQFKVYGPYEIPIEKKARGFKFKEDRSGFWEKIKADAGIKVSEKKGCYVFGMRSGGGITPLYVGRTTRQTLEKEAFADGKIKRYYGVMLDYAKGKPVMFFVVQESGWSMSLVEKLEKYLIDVGSTKNPDIQNDKGTKKPVWGIDGVLRSKKGKVPTAAKKFKQTMGLK